MFSVEDEVVAAVEAEETEVVGLIITTEFAAAEGEGDDGCGLG